MCTAIGLAERILMNVQLNVARVSHVNYINVAGVEVAVNVQAPQIGGH
jgi:hypothetical protein